MLKESSLIWPTFIQNKLDNLEKHIKFIHLPVKTKKFTLPPYYNPFSQKKNKITSSGKN